MAQQSQVPSSSMMLPVAEVEPHVPEATAHSTPPPGEGTAASHMHQPIPPSHHVHDALPHHASSDSVVALPHQADAFVAVAAGCPRKYRFRGCITMPPAAPDGVLPDVYRWWPMQRDAHTQGALSVLSGALHLPSCVPGCGSTTAVSSLLPSIRWAAVEAALQQPPLQFHAWYVAAVSTHDQSEWLGGSDDKLAAAIKSARTRVRHLSDVPWDIGNCPPHIFMALHNAWKGARAAQRKATMENADVSLRHSEDDATLSDGFDAAEAEAAVDGGDFD